MQSAVRPIEPGAHALVRSVGGVFWCSQAKARLVNSNQKSGGLAISMGVLPIGTRGRLWEAKDTVDKGLWECHIRSLQFPMTLRAIT